MNFIGPYIHLSHRIAGNCAVREGVIVNLH